MPDDHESAGHRVSSEQCLEWREQCRETDATPYAIARDNDDGRGRSTVSRHVHGQCHHDHDDEIPPAERTTRTTCPYCGADVYTFRRHLPCDPADAATDVTPDTGETSEQEAATDGGTTW